MPAKPSREKRQELLDAAVVAGFRALTGVHVRSKFPFVHMLEVGMFASRFHGYEGDALLQRVIADPAGFVRSYNQQKRDRIRALVGEALEGRDLSLDGSQLEALLSMYPITLALAGAGSGKTRLLVARVVALVNLWGVDPGKILVMCFARSACEEMRERLFRVLSREVAEQIEIRTFHALGRSILVRAWGTSPEIHPATLEGEGALERAIESLLRRVAIRHKDVLEALGIWFRPQVGGLTGAGASGVVLPLLSAYRSRVGWAAGLRAFWDTLGAQGENWGEQGPPSTLEEMHVVEALSGLGVICRPVEEPPVGHAWAGRVFLAGTQEDRSAYGLWCVMPSVNVSWVDGALRRGILSDRLAMGQMTVLDSDSCRDLGSARDSVQRVLEGFGDGFRPSPEEAIQGWMLNRGDAWQALVRTLVAWIRLWRSWHVGEDSEQRWERASRGSARLRAFRVIAESVWVGYEGMLAEGGPGGHPWHDFGDYLALAAGVVEEAPLMGMKPEMLARMVPWEHILVDEAQDSVPGAIELLRALRLVRPDRTRVFLVGDDWQSIYGWNGANRLFLRDLGEQDGADLGVSPHERGAGDAVDVCSLKVSYRCPKGVMAPARDFVLRNREQIERPFRGQDREGEIQVLVPWEGERLEREQLQEYLDQALLRAMLDARIRDSGAPRISAMVLSRYRHVPLLYGLGSDDEDMGRKRYRKAWARRGVDLRFLTLHAAKGLEADHVVLLEVGGAGGGFPPLRVRQDEIEVLSLLQEVPETYPHAEERRLFHVGLTRARRGVVVTCAVPPVSVFLQELVGDPRIRVRGWNPEGVPVSPRAQGGMRESCPSCGEGQMLRLRGLGVRVCHAGGCGFVARGYQAMKNL